MVEIHNSLWPGGTFITGVREQKGEASTGKQRRYVLATDAS